MKKVLVTGAGGPAGINFVMSLRIVPENMFLVGTEASEFFIHLVSTNKKYLIPRATESDYIDRLNEITRKEKIEFLHAQPDPEVEVVSENREKLEANTFLPSKNAVMACQDKLEATKLWEKKSVPVAKYVEIKNEADIHKAFCRFGKRIWIRATRGAGGTGSTLAENSETAISWVNYWRSRNVEWKFVAQENLPGRNTAFHSLWKDGELITSMARERVEYIYPHLSPSGITGTPTVQRTIHDETVNSIGTNAVLAVDRNFNGIACVDLKENSEGVPCVTEINAGRMFTTSFFFSYASKVLHGDYRGNIPYLYVRLAFGDRIPKVCKYDALPKNVYWIRHIDAPARLVRNQKTIGEMYH